MKSIILLVENFLRRSIKIQKNIKDTEGHFVDQDKYVEKFKLDSKLNYIEILKMQHN